MSKFILPDPHMLMELRKAWRIMNLVLPSWRLQMLHKFEAWVADHRGDMYTLLRRWFELERPLLLHSDLGAVFHGVSAEHAHLLANSEIQEIVGILQEAVCRPPLVYMAAREDAGCWWYVRLHLDRLIPEPVTVSEYLA